MEIRHLRYFLTIAEEKNITKAAEKLCISQPPLSKQMKELEEELGTQLFVRKSHGIELTEAGRLFQQYAIQIIELVGQADDHVRKFSAGLQGTVYLASVEGCGPQLLSEWISGFHKLYPMVQFDLWNGNSDDVGSRILHGLSDFGIVMEPYNSEYFHAVKVYEEPWIAMIPPDYELAKNSNDKISIKDLAPYELIVPSRNTRVQEITNWFKNIGEIPHIYCRMAHMLNAYELSAHGAGISIFPASASLYLSPERVCVKELAEPNVCSYVLISNPQRPLSLAAQEFLSYITSHIRY